jgi:hypothetical protein
LYQNCQHVMVPNGKLSWNIQYLLCYMYYFIFIKWFEQIDDLFIWSPTKIINFFRCSWLIDIKSVRIVLREFKQWWQSIPPISTKRTITSHHNWSHLAHTKFMTLEIQVLACDRHTKVAGISYDFFCIGI